MIKVLFIAVCLLTSLSFASDEPTQMGLDSSEGVIVEVDSSVYVPHEIAFVREQGSAEDVTAYEERLSGLRVKGSVLLLISMLVPLTVMRKLMRS